MVAATANPVLRPCVVFASFVLAVGSASCGEASDITDDSVGTSTTASEPRDQPDPDSRAGSAADALVADDIPADEQALNRVLDAMPNEMLGMQRERSDGSVIYRADRETAGEPVVFLEVAEADDVGVGDETNRELIESAATGGGGKVTSSQTDPSAGVMYVRATEDSGDTVRHILTWATEDGPFLFVAVADTSNTLDTLVDAFSKAAASP